MHRASTTAWNAATGKQNTLGEAAAPEQHYTLPKVVCAQTIPHREEEGMGSAAS